MFSLVSTAALFSSVAIAFSISASKEKECLPLQSLLNLGCSLFWILVSYSVGDAHEVLSILFPRRGVLLSVLWLISSAVPWWQASPSSICWCAICTSLLMKSRLIFYFFLFPCSAEIGSHSAGQAILEPTMQSMAILLLMFYHAGILLFVFNAGHSFSYGWDWRVSCVMWLLVLYQLCVFSDFLLVSGLTFIFLTMFFTGQNDIIYPSLHSWTLPFYVISKHSWPDGCVDLYQ